MSNFLFSWLRGGAEMWLHNRPEWQIGQLDALYTLAERSRHASRPTVCVVSGQHIRVRGQVRRHVQTVAIYCN
jgi:hypothetical protein